MTTRMERNGRPQVKNEEMDDIEGSESNEGVDSHHSIQEIHIAERTAATGGPSKKRICLNPKTDQTEEDPKDAETSEKEESDLEEYEEDTTTDGDRPGPSGMSKGSAEASLNEISTDPLLIKVEPEEPDMECCGNYDYVAVQILEPETKIEVPINPLPKMRICKKPLVHAKFKRHKNNKTNKTNKQSFPQAEELNQPIHCDICDETYQNNVSFGIHSIKHSDDKKYACHMCDFRNFSKYHMEMHIRAHDGTSKYKCEICNKAFTVSTHAIEHKYFHTGEKPFKCEICGKHFMFSWFLTSHRRSQHWEIMTGTPLVKYDCTICQKHYTSATGLKRHKLSQHNTDGLDVSVLCDICGKRLSNKEKLKFHRRIHTGYKPYGCIFCGKSFCRKEQLKEHERVHTGEKPYICKFCGKGFSQRSPLRIHERTHTGEKPYVCRICSRGFISKGVMDTHMKRCSATAIKHDI